MQVLSTKGDISSSYFKLMNGEITNKEFEELTGLEPEKNNPSRKDWLKRNKTK